MKIILASASPRRFDILKKSGYELVVIPSDYEEQINGKVYSDLLVENCAYQKALDVKSKIADDLLIVSADTVVVNNDVILGKPKDKNDAFNMLLALSDKTHFVATSVCLMYKNQVLKATEKTYVTFRKLSNKEILNYIENKTPLDKAGSYGIQDEGFDFSCKIVGQLDNVIGFPMNLFDRLLKEIAF